LNAAKDYEDSLDSRPVFPTDKALENFKKLDAPLSKGGEEAVDVIKVLNEVGTPGTASSRGGRVYGFVTGGALPVSVAANWMAALWDQNGGPYVLSPIAAKLEEIAAKWVLDLIGLPPQCGVGFVTGATMAGFTALCAARNAIYNRTGYDLKTDGIRNAPMIRYVMSDEIHPTNIIALQYMGYGKNELEFVKCDAQGRLMVSDLPKLDDHTILLLQAGNVNSGAYDPFEESIEIARQAGAWVHVDAAFGGWVAASSKKKHLTDGMEKADSWSLDCHKWLNIPHDSALAICRDPAAIPNFFGVSASYLVEGGSRENYHFTPELSRRARGIEVWAALKHLGKDGFADLIERTCSFAVKFANELEKMGFIILNDVCINQVVVTMKDESKVAAIIQQIQKERKTWFGPTNWRGHKAFRISVSSHATTDQDVDIALKAIKDALKRV
ncbi:MAG: aminotransferase class V-fold PLP-dependent enzyme, partial [Proteobacteria bacterium]|nr:aminotransferase class V-fold PLP-dependent enzyme [Pseudomonadota bacterium]